MTKYVRDIRDLEHPYSLEQLSVLSEDSITLDDKLNRVQLISECLPVLMPMNIQMLRGFYLIRAEGLRLNRRVGIEYLAVWLTRSGSVPRYNLMEDAAPAEISRVQNWQWIRYEVELDGDGLGVRVNKELFERVVEEEMERIEKEVGKDKFKKGMYKDNCKKFTKQCTASELDDFLTLAVYDHIVAHYPNNVSRP
ncbi:hypothetical protein HID58_034789 [Brassica napus]|uniref:Malate synthase C-terminal domain-containing protein n=1 Tax=Brassica napus TaxID=3708 RepID=A0ABQ8C4A9_BRANA|nr:hypothetical protein HID58_034789 [Brassica napus]